MRPATIFLAPQFKPGKPVIRIVRDVKGGASMEGELFKELPKGYGYTSFQFVDSLEKADFMLVPQPVRRLDEEMKKYLESVKATAQAAGKRVIVFLVGDTSYDVHIDGVILFCRSIFRYQQRSNEVQGTFVVEDFSEKNPLQWRPKRKKPVISFCGYAGFPSWKTRAMYVVNNLKLDTLALLQGNPNIAAKKRGIYYRRKSMEYLKGDSRFETNFIVRDTFSGNAKLIEGDPEKIRREYVDSIQNADFVLSPKGDPNQSTRFYEALTLGRIPILIDTDMVMPLEKIIKYDEFMVRVPFGDLKNLGDYVEKWYNALSEEEWIRRQKLAREAFVKYLRYDTFFNTVFPLLVEKGPETLN
jgi:hypothetical protein